MSHCSRIYYKNVCNRYLNLTNVKLTTEQFNDIIYCLDHPKEVPMSIRAKVADFTNTKLITPFNGTIDITEEILLSNINNSNILLVL